MSYYYELVILALEYANRPITVTDIHEIINYTFGKRITYNQIDNAINQKRKYIKSHALIYPNDNCHVAYSLKVNGYRLAYKIKRDLN